MKYATDHLFAGQRLSIGRTVLVCWPAPAMGFADADVLRARIYPAVVESIGIGDQFIFRLSDSRPVSSSQLDGYDITTQSSPPHGFIATTAETVGRLPLRTWTWAPRI